MGEIEKEDGVLVVKRIHVRYQLKAPEADRKTVERVLEIHEDQCPVARSIRDSIEITTEFVLK